MWLVWDIALLTSHEPQTDQWCGDECCTFKPWESHKMQTTRCKPGRVSVSFARLPVVQRHGQIGLQPFCLDIWQMKPFPLHSWQLHSDKVLSWDDVDPTSEGSGNSCPFCICQDQSCTAIWVRWGLPNTPLVFRRTSGKSAPMVLQSLVLRFAATAWSGPVKLGWSQDSSNTHHG